MYKICKKCNIIKHFTEFHKDKNINDGYRNTCKLCRKEYTKNYYVDNFLKINSLQKEYYKKDNRKEYRDKNKDKINEVYYNRKKIDPLFGLSCNLRSLVYNAYKINGFKKNSRTENILGCTFEEFKKYIENQFEPWMTENNQGKYTGNYNETWQLDHIEPVSNASTIEDVIKLNNYTNLRPLCSKKNLEKSNN